MTGAGVQAGEAAPPPGARDQASVWLTVYAAAVAMFHVWMNTIGSLPSLWGNSLHFASVGSLVCFAAAHRGPGIWRAWNYALGAVVLLCGVYPLAGEEWLHARGEVMILPDRLAAFAAVVAALILCRRTSGWTIPVLVLAAAGYVLVFGRYLDGIFHFRGLGLERVLYRFYFTEEGLFGMIATISASYVFMFILFSAFLLKSGGGEIIVRLAMIATGRVRGGAGYVSVISSALTGMITGSAVANTVSTGAITIPLMKRAGFRPAFAAAVETAASTGGQLMPPVMGAGAFIMAQYTGLPYATIIAAALLPALLYFASLGLYIFFETRTESLGERPDGEPERVLPVLREGIHFLIPIAALIALLVAGFSPAYAAGGGIAGVVASSWLSRRHRMGWRDVMEALAMGSRTAAPTALLLVCTGLVIGTLNMTGLAVAFSQLVLSWSGGYLLAALVLTAGASLVLGLGLPVTAAYVMLAAVAVPALQELGVTLLAAHMIIFWYSQDSNVTPPVCLAAYAAAGIAGSGPMETGLRAWKMAKALYVVPLLFAYTALLEGGWMDRVWVALFALGGFAAASAAIAGWFFGRLRNWQRAMLLLLSPALFWPDRTANVAGLLLLAGAVVAFRARAARDIPAGNV